MIVSGTNLTMTRGDSECLEVTISGYELQPGDKLEMTVRPYVGGKILLHKEITEFEGNIVDIPIWPEDTQSLSFGVYVYDLQLTFAGGAVKTIVKPSRFTIAQEVAYDY